MISIVVTDGVTLNPGDLSWQQFSQLGEVKVYERTSPAEFLPRCKDAHVILTNKTPVRKELIEQCPSLKIIAVTATGYNIIDVEAAAKRNIVVCNVPEYGTHSVAQHTIALLLELTNKVGVHEQSVRKGEWASSIDWTYSKAPIIELKDKVFGIVGLGKIGNQTAKIASALGMKVQYHRGSPSGVEAKKVSLYELFSTSDFVSLHCPLKPDNEKFVNASLLSSMKAGAYLINTSRGQLIDENDLAETLKAGKIAGAALDVLSKEPPAPDHPLLNLRNCVITPHNAWLSYEARSRILQTSFDNVRLALAGTPQNVVQIS